MAIVIIYMFLVVVLAAIILFLYLMYKVQVTARKEDRYYKRQAEQEAKFRRSAKEKRKQDFENINRDECLYESFEDLRKTLEELGELLEELERIRQEARRNRYRNTRNQQNTSETKSYIQAAKAYKTFGLTTETLTEESLKQSYRELVKKYHPDRNKAPNATEKFQKIQLYHALLQEELKAKHYR